jgi:hypothetical protein
MVRCGVPKEPKIMKMDWRSAGYWPVYKNGKRVWIPKNIVQEKTENHDIFFEVNFTKQPE